MSSAILCIVHSRQLVSILFDLKLNSIHGMEKLIFHQIMVWDSMMPKGQRRLFLEIS